MKGVWQSLGGGGEMFLYAGGAPPATDWDGVDQSSDAISIGVDGACIESS